MKKILLYVITLAMSLSAYASQTVPIVWPFSPASNQANALRVIIDNANKAQSKYNFVFENKPGAGGSIAVNHVINQTTPTLMMISTSVFVRPVYYPDQSYDINKLQPIAITSTGSPIAIIAKDSSNLEDLKKKQVLKIGIVQGSITESVARSVQKVTKNEVILVPYPGTINATNDMVGGHIDASVEFIKDSIPWVESGKAHIVGITGSQNIDSYKTFSSQGVKNTENLISNYYMLASKNMSSEVVQEMHDIITDAMLKQNILDVWKSDFASVKKRSYKETIEFWNTQKAYWESIK